LGESTIAFRVGVASFNYTVAYRLGLRAMGLPRCRANTADSPIALLDETPLTLMVGLTVLMPSAWMFGPMSLGAKPLHWE
jgi:hypothetical protein